MPFSALASAPAEIMILIFFGVWVGLWLPVAIPLAIALKWRPSQPLKVSQKLPLLASLYLIAPLVLWEAARIQGRSFSEYGLPWQSSVLISAGLGLGLGTLGLLGMLEVQHVLGWVSWQQPIRQEEFSSQLAGWVKIAVPVLISTLVLAAGISLVEELIFRGFLLNQLRQNYPAWTAAAIASLIFAVLHLVWEGKENIPQLPGLWLMGLVLVLARWVDGGNLGLAWGLHTGWIWTIASLETLEAMTYTQKGPEWMTGLGGKPLAGLMGLCFLLTTGLVLWGFNQG